MKIGRHLPPDKRAGTLTRALPPVVTSKSRSAPGRSRTDAGTHPVWPPDALVQPAATMSCPCAPVTISWQSAPAGTPVTRTSSSLPQGMAA